MSHIHIFVCFNLNFISTIIHIYSVKGCEYTSIINEKNVCAFYHVFGKYKLKGKEPSFFFRYFYSPIGLRNFDQNLPFIIWCKKNNVLKFNVLQITEMPSNLLFFFFLNLRKELRWADSKYWWLVLPA